MTRPAYFEEIRNQAARRWDQLESDPDLAGPWHQLFKQVQRPRHVLSELLQNADDAGATEATVRITDGEFIFSHNGEDFRAEHFASLCRFGYSNKRSLHTIGFRGIGFKSTFSIGSPVRLYTPSLAVAFDKMRFTEPYWIVNDNDEDGRTHICVTIEDSYRQQELEKNLQEWLESPASLLFFKSIRSLRVGENEVRWIHQGVGPVADSEWVALSTAPAKPYLLLRSPEEEFPQEALEEIRQERMVAVEEETAFPPCRVELVLGIEGRLFVVLPTGVKTDLPFACNAPFVQDPARVEIKDPGISDTNRWLLERAGKLAAQGMLEWLASSEQALPEASRAYELMPSQRTVSGANLEDSCNKIAINAFAQVIDGEEILLTINDELVVAHNSIIIPDKLSEIWSVEQVVALLDKKRRSPLSPFVSSSNRSKLKRWKLIDEFDRDAVISGLETREVPKPHSWRQLLTLWTYIGSDLPRISYSYRYTPNIYRQIRIFPVPGQEILFSQSALLRLPDKGILQSEDDWHFLFAFLQTLDPSWLSYLAEQHIPQEAKRRESEILKETDIAEEILRKFQLDKASEVAGILNQVINAFFKRDENPIEECVRLAQILAKLSTGISTSFHYFTRNGILTELSYEILVDEDGFLEGLLPKTYLDAHLIHPAYTSHFTSCTRQEWSEWVASGKAGLRVFLSLRPFKRVSSSYRWELQKAMVELHSAWHPTDWPYQIHRHYSSQEYVATDFDLPSEIVSRWDKLTPENRWQIVRLLMRSGPSYWKEKTRVIPSQTSTNGQSRREVQSNTHIPAAWLRRLQESECLLDTHGRYRKPADLLRRTAQTEALLDVEAFVAHEFDTPANRELLDLLGVGSTPTGPDRLLTRLEALSQSQNPPVGEIERFYRRLDQLIDNLSTIERSKLWQAFRSRKIIYTEQNSWEGAPAVFLSVGDEKLPGIATIRPAVAELSLWSKVGVADRPTEESILRWLDTLESGVRLAAEDFRRVRAVLPRFPLQIWEECQHWLNLAGEWTPLAELQFSLTLQSLTAWQHLHQWVKQQTADFQSLSAAISQEQPFADLPTLASKIEERLQQTPGMEQPAQERPWLTAIGRELCRIQLDDEDETSHIRSLAQRLAVTRWQPVQGIESLAYIDGVPAGTSRPVDLAWSGESLFVGDLPHPKLAKLVPEEIGKHFARPDIKAALDYSFERTEEQVRAYLQENFTLADELAMSAQESEANAEGVALDSAVASADPQTPVEDDESDYRNGENDFLDSSDFGYSSGSSRSSSYRRRTSSVNANGAGTIQSLTLIERFARANGFRLSSTGIHTHPDGRRLLRSPDDQRLWELRSVSGDPVRYYFPKEHCLQHEPLAVETDAWMLLQNHPDLYALLLLDGDDRPLEMTGAQLQHLREKGTIVLHPATYRVEYIHDRQPIPAD